MELADAVIVNKADGSNKKLAEKTKAEYNRILHFLQPATKGWQTRAYTCSSVLKEGIPEIWKAIKTFEDTAKSSGVFEERRRLQTKQWIHSMILDQLQFSFFIILPLSRSFRKSKMRLSQETGRLHLQWKNCLMSIRNEAVLQQGSFS